MLPFFRSYIPFVRVFASPRGLYSTPRLTMLTGVFLNGRTPSITTFANAFSFEYVKEEVKVEETQSATAATPDIKVGDVVDFTGTTHFTSSYATAVGKTCKPGKVKITAINLKGKHPYHSVAVSGGGSTAYGWLDASDIEGVEAEYVPVVGDKVKITKDAPVYGKTYKFSSWVYSCTLFVRSVSGSRIVVSTQKTGAVTGAVDKKYLTKV